MREFVSMIAHLTPKQAELYGRLGRIKMYPVAFTEDWTHYTDTNYQEGDVRFRQSREKLKNLKYKDGIFTATYEYTTQEPDETAIAELNALAESWYERGRGDLAENLLFHYGDEGDKYDVRDTLTNTVKHRRKIRVVNPVFYAPRVEVTVKQEKWTKPKEGTYLTREMMDKAYKNITLRASSLG